MTETPAERDARLRREANAYVRDFLRDVWWLVRPLFRLVWRGITAWW